MGFRFSGLEALDALTSNSKSSSIENGNRHGRLYCLVCAPNSGPITRTLLQSQILDLRNPPQAFTAPGRVSGSDGGLLSPLYNPNP